MLTDLQAHVLRITAEVTEPLMLDEHPGSSVRGALFQALLRRFCTNRDAPTCAECPLNQTCPVAGLVAPLRDEHPRGRDIPRPFVLATAWVAVPSDGPTQDQEHRGHRLGPGQRFHVRLTLFGRAIAYLPYIALSMPTIEAIGLGRPLAANQGRRVRFRVERIDVVDPFGEEAQPLYQRGQTAVASPMLTVAHERIAARADHLCSARLTLRFLTPTRLVAGGQLVRCPDLSVLTSRLAERLDALEREYGAVGDQPAPIDTRERARMLADQASRITLVRDETRWVEVSSHSARQKRSTPIGGLVGVATYEGDFALPLRELLVWGEVLHVGKNAVKGDGRYQIEVG
jgi:hypothetical protein